MCILPLTEKACAHCWHLSQADGGVGPRAQVGGSQLGAVVHAVYTQDSTFHPPSHVGYRDPIEGAAALQNLLQRARGRDQPGRYCGEGGPGVGRASWCPFSISTFSRTQPFPYSWFTRSFRKTLQAPRGIRPHRPLSPSGLNLNAWPSRLEFSGMYTAYNLLSTPRPQAGLPSLSSYVLPSLPPIFTLPLGFPPS